MILAGPNLLYGLMKLFELTKLSHRPPFRSPFVVGSVELDQGSYNRS